MHFLLNSARQNVWQNVRQNFWQKFRQNVGKNVGDEILADGSTQHRT
jgi:hypothetical protein